MRRIDEQVDINYKKLESFFSGRAKKFSEEKPEVAVLYQDGNPDIAKRHDMLEKERLLPKLKLGDDIKVLDVGCGIGRWADVLIGKVKGYLGIDFSSELLEIANSRIKHPGFLFQQMSAADIERDKLIIEPPFDLFMISGLIMYLNNSDALNCLNMISELSSGAAQLCLREPIGLEYRLTLDDIYSEELQSDYSAIYRTRGEFLHLFEQTVLRAGFKLIDEAFLYQEGSLNVRKETAKYYFILSK